MSLLVRGVTRLSSLEIDTDKNWAGRPIKNLGSAVDSNDAVVKAQAILQSVMTTRGDIIYRGNNEAARLEASYGAGYNFLHLRNTGQLELEWLDIQELISYLAGAKNRLIAPPALQTPEAVVVAATAEEHSGGGFMDGKVLQLPEPAIISGGATEDHSGGGQETAPTLNIPVPSIGVTAQLV